MEAVSHCFHRFHALIRRAPSLHPKPKLNHFLVADSASTSQENAVLCLHRRIRVPQVALALARRSIACADNALE